MKKQKVNFQITNILEKVILSLLIYFAILFSLLSMLQVKQLSFIALIPGMIVIFILNIWQSKKVHIVVYSFLFVLLIVSLFESNQFFFTGLLFIWNQMVDTVGIHTGVVLSKYDIKNVNLQFAGSYFGSYFSIFIALLTFFTLKHKRNYVLWLVILPIFIIQLVTNMMPNFYYNVLLILSVLLLINYCVIHRTNIKNKYQNGKVFISTSITIIFGFLLCLLVFNLILPKENYTKPVIVKTTKAFIEDKVNEIRFEKNKTNTYTQGDFRKLGELKLSENEALEVVMDKPTSLYLRGFVGEKYTSERWEKLDPEKTYNANNLFYWLNHEGFSPHNQLSSAYNLANKKTNKTIKMTIHNLHGNSKYVYTPYELSSNVEKIKNIKVTNDSALQSESFFGNRLYNYEVKEKLVKQFPKLAGQIYELKNQGKAKEFLNQEGHYNQFVYENYTDIPKPIETLLKNNLEVVVEGKGQHIPYEQAINFVRKYLKGTLKYDEHPSQVPKNQDFLTYLLEDSKSGYAAHFATAGTMIFRYLGIPARYVEGYLITPKDVKGKSEYERIAIPGKNAHAWTEIYIDQVGWIPIEVTPTYYDVMEPIDFSDYPLGEIDKHQTNSKLGISKEEEPQASQQVVDYDTSYDVNNQEPPKKLRLGFIVMLILLIVILLLIIGYIGYIIHKRKKLSQFKKTFQSKNYHVAISNLFSYSMSLLKYNGLIEKGGSIYQYKDVLFERYSNEYVEKFLEAVAINQEARYSNENVSEEKYNEMYRFMEDTVSLVLKKKSKWKQLKMKYIDFIL